MIDYKCEKCNKKFSTKSNLNQHLKRKYPCNVETIFKCERCQKVFDYKHHYVRHTSRKFPCEEKEPEEVILAKINLQLEQEKTKQLKEEAKLEQLKSKNINIDNSMNNCNNTNINITLNNFRDNPKNTREILQKLSLNDFRYLVDNNAGIRGTIENIFRHFYNNPNFPENKTLSIPDVSKDDFAIYLDNMWKKVQYDRIRRPIINQLLQTIDHVMMYFCTPEDASGINLDRELCLTHQDHYEQCDEFIKNQKNDKHIKQSLQDALFQYMS